MLSDVTSDVTSDDEEEMNTTSLAIENKSGRLGR
jgi:hypothetical protein